VVVFGNMMLIFKDILNKIVILVLIMTDIVVMIMILTMIEINCYHYMILSLRFFPLVTCSYFINKVFMTRFVQ